MFLIHVFFYAGFYCSCNLILLIAPVGAIHMMLKSISRIVKSPRLYFRSTLDSARCCARHVRTLAQSFYEFSAKSLAGKEVDFANYKGKVVLIENVATL